MHRQGLSLVDSGAGGQDYSSIIPGVTGHESKGRRGRERPQWWNVRRHGPLSHCCIVRKRAVAWIRMAKGSY